jgi:hypothetical protein
MLIILGSKAMVAAVVTTRGGQQKNLDAFGCVFCESAADPQTLVIGVS